MLKMGVENDGMRFCSFYKYIVLYCIMYYNIYNKYNTNQGILIQRSIKTWQSLEKKSMPPLTN